MNPVGVTIESVVVGPSNSYAFFVFHTSISDSSRKTYLKTYVKPMPDFKGSSMYLFYCINQSEHGTKVNTIPTTVLISVQPTVIHEGDPVNVELLDTRGTSGLTVTDMGGRTVFSTVLPEEGIYQIPGRVMSHGMNIVTVTPTDSKPVSTKVLVK